jgi:hypothetical protein
MLHDWALSTTFRGQSAGQIPPPGLPIFLRSLDACEDSEPTPGEHAPDPRRKTARVSGLAHGPRTNHSAKGEASEGSPVRCAALGPKHAGKVPRRIAHPQHFQSPVLDPLESVMELVRPTETGS